MNRRAILKGALGGVLGLTLPPFARYAFSQESPAVVPVGEGFVTLTGAYVGSFPLYDRSVPVPALGFAKPLRAVGVPAGLADFDGITCFSFVNQFTYGNFGDPGLFGLES